MSTPALPTPSSFPPPNLQDEPILYARGHGMDELAAKIEVQRAKVRALELAAEERRRSDELRIQEQARRAESRNFFHSRDLRYKQRHSTCDYA
jgi:hypothetical protein